MEAGIYKHHMGGYYQVLGVGEHSETYEPMVVYISLTGIELPGMRMRIRPLDGPNGFRTMVKVPDPADDLLTIIVPRFTHVGDELVPHREPGEN